MNATEDQDAQGALDHEDIDGPPRGFYADDVPFRSGVVQQQAPLYMAYVAALNGYNPPRPQGDFAYCDLGCGNGTTLNAYAALYPEARFVGIDFNAGHIAQARDQAAAAGLKNVRYVQGSFAEIDTDALPAFDFIGMNGIYSWLDRDILPAAQALVERSLKPGGLFYVEYMCMPGMVAVVPMWHLMQALVPDTGEGSHQRATRALRLLEELYNSGVGYLDRHPTAKNAVQGYATRWRQNENQIDHFAHNAMASGFRPRFFNEMCREMATAGLSFAGRTQSALNDPDLAVTLQQASILRGIEDRMVRELLSDFLRNERNRRDVFVKGAKPDPAGARAFLLDELRLMSRTSADRLNLELSLPGPRKMALDSSLYRNIAAQVDGAARSLRETDPEGRITDDTLATAGHRLEVTGQFFLCEPGFAGGPLPAAPERVSMPLAMNRVLLDEACAKLNAMPVLARPVGGTAMAIGPLEAVLLKGWLEAGQGEAIAWALDFLATCDGQIQMQRRTLRGPDITAEMLQGPLNRLIQVRVPNLLRLGALVEAD